MMESARVLLVEDDAPLQRFVSLALSELPLELHCCDSVDTALALLEKNPGVQLILTDLMLPGRSGFELIENLAQRPAPLPRIVVFSAGLSTSAQARLAELPVWRLLAKPCTVLALEACVREALQFAEEAPSVAAATGHRHADAAVQHFGGDQALYDGYRAGCLRQFAADAAAGDAACAARDAQALLRLAHNLKSVLLLLGHESASAQASQLEHAASIGAWDAALPLWQDLRESLQGLD